jgi:hypothetical protein
MNHSICNENSQLASTRNEAQPVTRFFKSWLALGLLLNLSFGQLPLPIGPLWLWLVLIPALCAMAVPGVLNDFSGVKWTQLLRFGKARRRAQATRKPLAQP